MRRLTIVSIFLFALNACVTVQEHTLPPDSDIGKQAAWEVHRVNLETMQTWSLKAALRVNPMTKVFAQVYFGASSIMILILTCMGRWVERWLLSMVKKVI